MNISFICLFIQYQQALFHWYPLLYCHTSVTAPSSAAQKQMCLTIGRPGSSSQAAGCTLSCGQCPHSLAGAAMVLRVPAPPVQSSGTSTPRKQDLTSSASLSFVCCCLFFWWSTATGRSSLPFMGWGKSERGKGWKWERGSGSNYFDKELSSSKAHRSF